MAIPYRQEKESIQRWAEWLMRINTEARHEVSNRPWTLPIKERVKTPEWQHYESKILERLRQVNVPKTLPSAIYDILEDENYHDLNRILVKHGYLTLYGR